MDTSQYLNDDVFQLLESESFDTKCRWFSCSIDENDGEYEDNELMFLHSGLVPPPSSPIIEDSGIIYSDNTNEDENKYLISSKTDYSFYNIPKRITSDAYKIWKDANIPETDTIYHIELKLLEWARINATLEIMDNKIISITWKSVSGCGFQSSWSAFIKWIICASVHG